MGQFVLSAQDTSTEQALYSWQYSTPVAGLPWIGLYVDTLSQPPQTVALGDSFTDPQYQSSFASQKNGGCYIFAPSAPADYTQFMQAFKSQCLAPLNTILNPSWVRFFCWVTSSSDGKTLNCDSYISFANNGSGFQTQNSSAIIFRALSLNILLSSGIAPLMTDEVQTGFVINPPLTQGYFQMTGAESQQTFGKLSALSLPFDGSSANAALAFNMTLKAGGLIQDDFDYLKVGVKYYYTGSQYMMSHRYRILDTPDPDKITSVNFSALMDPLNALDPNRTCFVFADPSLVFGSGLSTDYGRPVFLQPISGSTKLVLADDISIVSPSNTQIPTYYTTFSGDFVLSLASDDNTPNPHLRCGLSATETISFAPARGDYAGDLLCFSPGDGAHASQWPLGSVSLADPPPPSKLLDSTYTTAWACVRPNTGGTEGSYYSQPQGASLYAANGNGVNAQNATLLGYFQPVTVVLDATAQGPFFPLASYTDMVPGATKDSMSNSDVLDFESLLLSPTRRGVITEIIKQATMKGKLRTAEARRVPLADTPVTTTTTPQGLLVDVAGNEWQTLYLAQNTDTETFYMRFQHINPTLQNGFQTNQQFLVITSPTPGWDEAQKNDPGPDPNPDGKTIFNNVISIAGWPFKVNVNSNTTYGDYQNVLIFKFCTGTVKEMVANPMKWTNASDFNRSASNELVAISQWLQSYIVDAERNVGNPYFTNFLNIISDPTWNGILALKVDLILTEMPPELQGLMAGINLQEFNGHHLGIQVNPITGDLNINGNSSLFGLVYYVNPAYQRLLNSGGDPETPISVQTRDPYAFNVLSLKALFVNSSLQGFDSKAQININNLFGDTVPLMVPGTSTPVNNAIVLDGSYQNHNGTANYVFRRSGSFLLNLQSNVLLSVMLTNLQFTTLTYGDSQAAADISSCFTLTGFMSFAALPGFDSFSFGSTDGSSGLAFSNLLINMSFNSDTPETVNWAFDPSLMAFNIANSVARQGSLFENFPLQFTGLVSGSGKKPADMGFLPVRVQLDSGNSFTSLTEAWYGLQFDLNLGTAGALASSVGLVSSLLLSWSPGSIQKNIYRASTGLSLPGSGGGNTNVLSLQDVLKLNIGDIRFVVDNSSGRPAYMLKLYNIALSLLGIKLPPQGQTVFFLFGNPDPDAPRSSLGWYACYNNEPAKSS